jgi:hypothetical protein
VRPFSTPAGRKGTISSVTTNYDAIVAALNLDAAPDGLIVHTAGFDHERGVFRILDIWESRKAGERFIKRQAQPDLERFMAQAAEGGVAPTTADYWYDLHDTMS